MVKNNNNNVLFVVILLILALVFFGYFKWNNNDEQVIKVVEDQLNYKNKNFNELLSLFENDYKATIVSTERGDYQSALNSSSDNLLVIKKIYQRFRNNRPLEYKNTENWAKKLELIYESSILSRNLIKDKKMSEAMIELDKIRRILREIRKENSISNFNDDLLDFYDSLQPIVLADKKSETIKYMKDMKLQFLRIKELSQNTEHGKEINNIEQAISGIDRLVASDFKISQDNLKKYFEDLYLVVN